MSKNRITARERHADGAALLERLKEWCADAAHQDCRRCAPARRRSCADALADVLDESLAFFFDLFRTEESLMKALPREPGLHACCEHHRADHADIVARLSALAGRLDGEDAIALRDELRAVVEHWLQAHTREHDEALGRAMAASGIRPAKP